MTVYNLDTSTLATTYDELSDSQFTRGSELVEVLKISSKQGTTSTELINLLTDAGFEVDEVAVRRNSTYHESGARLVEFLESSTFGNLLVHVPEELRASARAEYVEALEAISAGQGINSVGFGISAIAHRTFTSGLPLCNQSRGCNQGGEFVSLARLHTSG